MLKITAALTCAAALLLSASDAAAQSQPGRPPLLPPSSASPPRAAVQALPGAVPNAQADARFTALFGGRWRLVSDNRLNCDDRFAILAFDAGQIRWSYNLFATVGEAYRFEGDRVHTRAATTFYIRLFREGENLVVTDGRLRCVYAPVRQ